jgi:glycine/D-amino acid oxidase-like deaminating enzyme
MTVDYIVIGQGISGTWLSYYLLNANKSIVVIDKENLQSASNIAGGLVNPVTGRRVVTTWLAEELMPFVWDEYNALGQLLNIQSISKKNILVFPTAPDLMNAFTERMQNGNGFIKTPSISKDALRAQVHFPFEVFEIDPGYVINMHDLLQCFRNYLHTKDSLMNEWFDESMLIFKTDHIEYKSISAQKIIYADGIQSAGSIYWNKLPFVLNKGQALLLETDGLNTSYTYKFGHLTLASLSNNLWWVGSSNELQFASAEPSEDFKERTAATLRSILKIPFTIKEHVSAIRSATVERRPFVGVHPVHKQLAILNGMGSKGCSLAPWFAKELADNLIKEKSIDSSADVQRFGRLLSR